MKIVDVRAFPTSFPVPAGATVTLGIGRAVKRDAVVVKVTTASGLVGWGEAHHARAPGAVEVEERCLEKHPVIDGPGYV